MSNYLIEAILLNHGQQVKTVQGLLMAYSEYTIDGMLCGEWVNVTGYSLKQLRDYLNY